MFVEYSQRFNSGKGGIHFAQVPKTPQKIGTKNLISSIMKSLSTDG